MNERRAKEFYSELESEGPTVGLLGDGVRFAELRFARSHVLYRLVCRDSSWKFLQYTI